VSGCSYIELNQFLKDNYGVAEFVAEYDEGGLTCIVDYVTDGENSRIFLVWSEKNDDIFTIMHETLHLVVKIFGYTGAAFSGDNEETIARYQEFWVRKFLDAPAYPKRKTRKNVKTKKSTRRK
jgi:hypothetical protein